MAPRLARLLFLMCVALVAGCKDSSSTPTSAPPPPPKADLPLPLNSGQFKAGQTPKGSQVTAPEVRPDFKSSARDFAHELTIDQDAFAKKYSNKQVELTGEVLSVIEDISGTGTVSLKGDPEARFSFVVCSTRNREPWNRVKPGQNVRIMGRIPEGAIGLFLFECYVLDVTGDPPPTISADALAKAFATDPEGAEKKWRNKYMIVTGRVTEVKPPQGTEVRRLVLESDPAKPAIAPSFGLVDEGYVKAVKVGQRVQVMVECMGLTAEKDKLIFFNCRLLEVSK